MNKKASLNQRMKAIGFRIGYDDIDVIVPKEDWFQFDIEKTLIDSAFEAQKDYRILSLLMTWISVHGDRVIIEKLFKLSSAAQNERGHNPIINGIAVWGTVCGYNRFKRYISHSKQDEYLVDREMTESFESFQGLKEDWLKYGVKVPLKMVRIRIDDILSDEDLARSNLQYRNRLLVGASWRADILTAVELGMKTATEISKKTGCSYEPAHRVLKEITLAKKAGEAA